jgi:hypothetical protein
MDKRQKLELRMIAARQREYYTDAARRRFRPRRGEGSGEPEMKRSGPIASVKARKTRKLLAGQKCPGFGGCIIVDDPMKAPDARSLATLRRWYHTRRK